MRLGNFLTRLFIVPLIKEAEIWNRTIDARREILE